MKKVSAKMSLLEKISYGSGNMGLCLCTSVVTSFIMYFYTDVVQLTLTQVGTIMLIGGVADAISDLLMGIIVDKTHTRWGKGRPYLLFASIPLAIACMLAFYVIDASEETRYIYALVTYILYTVAYTAICIPQTTLLASITDDNTDRLQTNMFGSLGTTIGQFAVSAFALAAVALLGNGSERIGYQRMMVVFGTLGAIFLLVDFFNTNERIVPPASEKISARDSIRSMNNGPWIICAITSLCAIAAIVVRASCTMYYATYVMGNADLTSTLLTITTLVGVPVSLLTPVLAVKFGKKNCLVVSTIVSIIGMVGVFVVGSNVTAVIVLTVIIAIGMAMPNGVIYVMTAEAIDYGEWKHGIRVQGFLLAFVGFGVKVGGSIANMVTSKILEAGGYVGGAEIQSEAAKTAITINYLGVPMILLVVIVIVNLFYTLDKKYPQIHEELVERRAAKQQENQ